MFHSADEPRGSTHTEAQVARDGILMFNRDKGLIATIGKTILWTRYRCPAADGDLYENGVEI